MKYYVCSGMKLSILVDGTQFFEEHILYFFKR
jgi:hypothetical protein